MQTRSTSLAAWPRRAGQRARVLLAIVVLALAGCGAQVAVPPRPDDAAAEQRDAKGFVDALRPQRDARPVVAVVALNEGTEITDFLLTHGVMKRADVADVHAVAPRSGKVALYPALDVEVDHDFARFDRAYPAGADYVIVPAMKVNDDPAIVAWLRRQASLGARVIGICAGALVLGEAGLIDGRRFTTHWHYRRPLIDDHPSATYVPHRRYVIDGNIATTTGVTASVPAMLALVEAIGGRDKARAVADELGVSDWSPAHDSTPFVLDAERRWNYLLNAAAFWRGETWRADVHDGTDDIALALAADAWTRTGHIAVKAAAPAATVTLRSGLLLTASPVPAGLPRLPVTAGLRPVQQLERTLCEIEGRYGAARREWVRFELEYPGAAGTCNG